MFGADGALVVPDGCRRPRPTVPNADRRRAGTGQRLRRRYQRFQAVAGGRPSCRLGRSPRLPRPRLRCCDLARQARGSGRTYDKLFVRHWDTWAEQGTKSRLYSFPIADGKLSGGGVRLTGNLEGDTPSKPFGGGEEIAFSPDGRTVYFALREAGRIESTSTNLDIFSHPATAPRPRST